tara:strand:- start:811 stop:1269 length:459 start_codon:yes stop_codon:yes gene_type:complete
MIPDQNILKRMNNDFRRELWKRKSYIDVYYKTREITCLSFYARWKWRRFQNGEWTPSGLTRYSTKRVDPFHKEWCFTSWNGEVGTHIRFYYLDTIGWHRLNKYIEDGFENQLVSLLDENGTWDLRYDPCHKMCKTRRANKRISQKFIDEYGV